VTDLHLGHSANGPVTMTKEARDVHMHVIGLSRQGKSFFLEHMIRQDIENGAGVCVIDPHGEMYDNLVEWLAANDMHRQRRIHLINPSAQKWSVGFNPLCRGDANPETRVGAMLDACQKVWQDDESQGHKTLRRLLDMVFMTLAYQRLSLREAYLLTTLQYRDLRQQLVEDTGDAGLIAQWAEIDAMDKREAVAIFQAVQNRLWELTRTPGVQSMLGQTENVLDFKMCMERNHIVLVNLAHKGKIRPQVATMLGALLIADLHYSAQSRNIYEAKENPFYCYIDECGKYVNQTVVEGLDETAKFGLHYVLSHQRLSHLGDRKDHPIRSGVMGGAQNKVVFLQEDDDTTSELGEFLFGKLYDLEKPKDVLIKPAVVGYTYEWLESEGYAEGVFEGEGIGTGLSDNVAQRFLGDETEAEGHVVVAGTNTSESSMSGRSKSRSHGRSQALIPILEDLPGGVYSLDEMRHLGKVQVRLLQKRQAIAYTADERQPVQFCTADVSPPSSISIEQISAFEASVRDREPYCQLTLEVEQAITRRAAAIQNSSLLGSGDGFD
jgi:hypothetical protein